ncbi:hypothetical protein A2955_03205 [Candidatus Woesebacteria bacterium RIFCSPLOWO2_01_FULL_37_19]|uniref:Uncharacterized protein n=2 Tax=Candidatus Woeseibacteriota TaxID=1752722 RepID=A0A1F8B4N4_9BACT|nr:MAG: hypothetical protein A2771_01425 [Candidatus Woesebacteria bacterium RIFCSPHIGHO2_01_FULL_38_26b]OGM59003.1 MAG: hypothetical protein A2955_03205 [Candidatus Woesebacteria bacterium RIFCSPLOWO2_01_FULL_37_19]
MHKLTRHIQHYLPLIGVFLVGILGFRMFAYDRVFQSVIVVATAASYVAWGFVHHHIHDDLHLSVILEYIAIAFLGVVIVFSVLFRA